MYCRLLLLLGAAACASTVLSGFDEPDFGEVVSEYRGLQSHKALALTTEANGRWAYGVRFAVASPEKAIHDALTACRAAARAGGMRAGCYPFAIENEPARETLRGCSPPNRRIGSRRCAMQRQYQGALRRD